MAQQDHDPDLNRLGRELRGLTPRPCPINRDAVMFRAGQASVPRRWLWPVLTALSACVAVMCAAALFIQPGQPPVPYYPANMKPNWSPGMGVVPSQPSVVTPHGMSGSEGDDAGEPGASAAGRDDRPTPDSRYSQAQNNILRWGLDGIPMPHSTPAPRPAEKPDMLLRSF
jgi:hypothetical protein